MSYRFEEARELIDLLKKSLDGEDYKKMEELESLLLDHEKEMEGLYDSVEDLEEVVNSLEELNKRLALNWAEKKQAEYQHMERLCLLVYANQKIVKLEAEVIKLEKDSARLSKLEEILDDMPFCIEDLLGE